MSPLLRKRIKLMAGEDRLMAAHLAIRTREEVAKIMGISRQHVEQTERVALWKLRHRMAEYRKDLEGI